MYTIIVQWIGASHDLFTTRILFRHLAGFTADVTNAGGHILSSELEY